MANSETKLFIPGSPGTWVEWMGIPLAGGGYGGAVAVHGKKPSGAIDLINTSAGGDIQFAAGSRLFPWTRTTVVPKGTDVLSGAFDASVYAIAQAAVSTDQPGTITLYQAPVNDFTDLTKCLISSMDLVLQAGVYRALLVVDLAWQWIEVAFHADAAVDETWFRGQASLV
jgi:hypothetical protein